jgi:hypothetical protein
MSRVALLVALHLAPGLAFRVKVSNVKNSSEASTHAALQGECDGAYSIPNYLFTANDGGQAWKYGIPPGARVTLKRDFTSSMNQWLNGKRGTVVADRDGTGLTPDYMDHRRQEVCYFAGYIHFDDVPDGRLGQKNKFMYQDSSGRDVYGVNMGKFTVMDVVIEPESLETNLHTGYKTLGLQLDSEFRREILSDVLKPIEVIKPLEDAVVSPPLLEIKPEILLEVAELIPDMQLLQPIKPIIEAKLEALDLLPDNMVVEKEQLQPLLEPIRTIVAAKLENTTSYPDSVVVEKVQLEPLLHVVDVGQMAVLDEIVLDSVVRTIALPPNSRKDSSRSGKKAGDACNATGMDDVKNCCTEVTSKFWIIDCCWQACHKLFVNQQGVCMAKCKDGRVD